MPRKYGQRVYKRKRSRHAGWAVQRAQIQSIPRLTFKPMSIIRTSDYRCTFRVNLGAVWQGYPAGQLPTYSGEDRNWYGTININSIFPWFKSGLTPAQSLDSANFDPHNGMYCGLDNGLPGGGGKADAVINNTIFEGPVPKACPASGLSYSQMIATDPDGNFTNQPTSAPGLFENDDSPGYQYSEIGVLGSKLTLKFVPLPSQTDIRDQAHIDAKTAVASHDTEPAELYCFLHTQSAQPALDTLCSKDSKWLGTGINGEPPLANLPYIRSRVISGNVSSQGAGLANNYSTNKQGNAAVLSYKYGASTVHQCDVMDEDKFWTRTDQSNGFANPAELDHLTFGIRRHLSGPPRGRCAPSGFVELRLEQIIMLRKPVSTRTQHMAQQAHAQAMGGPDPGGRAGMFPQSMMNKGGAIGIAAGALHVANLLAP